LSFVAVRAADARARLVVASRPSVSTSAPAPVSVHQTGWLAAASPSGADSWSWVVMIAPTIATRGAVRVTASRAELDSVLHETVDSWLAADWPFTDVRYRSGV
jgi:hypothetical protein